MTDPTRITLTAEDRTGQAIGSAVGRLNDLTQASGFASSAMRALFGAVTIGGMVEMVRNTTNAADALSKLSQRTGATVESLSALQYAASLNDASVKDLELGLKGLSNKMLDAAKGGKEAAAAFSAVGVDITDAGGKMRGVDAVFADVAEAFSQMEDGAAKSALANKLMEESGIRLIPTLNAGRDGLAAMGEEAARFGAVISTDLANASVLLNDNLTRMNAQLGAGGTKIAAELVPALLVMSDALVETGSSSDLASVAAEGLRTVLETFIVTGANVGYVLKQIGNEIGGMGAQLGALLSGDFKGFSEIGRLMKEDAEKARKAIDDFSAAVLNAGKSGKDLGKSAEEQKTRADAAARAMQAYRDAVAAAASSSKEAGKEINFVAHAFKSLDKELASVRKFLDEVNRNQTDGEKAALDELRRITESLEARRDENQEIGKSASALRELRAARIDAAAALKLERAEAIGYFAEGQAIAEVYRQQAAALRELAEEMRTGSARQAAVESAEAARDAWARISDDISQSLTDAILAGGSSGWDLLRRQIEATVIRATVAPLVQGGVNSALQGVGLGPAVGGAQLASGVGAGFATLGAANLVGMAGGDALGALIAGNASTWGVSAAGVTGGASIMGTMAAAAPYIAAAIFAAQALGAFDGATPHRGGAATSTGGIASLATNSTLPGFGLDWGAFRSDRSAGVDSAVATVVSGLDNTLSSMLAALGLDSSGISVSGRFASDNDDASPGAIRISKNGEVLADVFRKFNKSAEKGFQEFAQEGERALLQALQALTADTGSLAEGIVAAVDPAVASLDAIRAALAQVSEVTGAEKALEQFSDIDGALQQVRRAGLDATAQFYLLGDELRDAARSGSLSTQQIVGALQSRYAAELQMLQSIDAASKSIGASFADSIRGIRLSVLDAAGQYEFLDNEAARYLDTLKGLTDPGLISEYASKLQGSITQAFGLLDDSEKTRLADEFVARLEQAEGVAQGRLEASRQQAIADQQELAAIMRDALTSAANQMAAQLAAAGAAIPKNIGVTVRVDSPVPAVAEVGFSG